MLSKIGVSYQLANIIGLSDHSDVIITTFNNIKLKIKEFWKNFDTKLKLNFYS